LEKERAKLVAEMVQLERQLAAVRGKLANKEFLAKAPSAVIELEREKERSWSVKRGALASKLQAFGG